MNRTTKTKKAYKPEKLELEGILALTKEDNLQRWAMLHLSYYAGLRSMEISQLDFGHDHQIFLLDFGAISDGSKSPFSLGCHNFAISGNV